VTGNCAFLFRGSAGEVAVLRQKAAGISTHNAALADDSAEINFLFRYFSSSSASRLKATLKVVYTLPGSAAPVTVKRNIVVIGASLVGGSPAWAVYGETVPVPQGATLIKAQVIFRNQSSGGRLFIEDIGLGFQTQSY
jgi:hypothetical protein